MSTTKLTEGAVGGETLSTIEVVGGSCVPCRTRLVRSDTHSEYVEYECPLCRSTRTRIKREWRESGSVFKWGANDLNSVGNAGSPDQGSQIHTAHYRSSLQRQQSPSRDFLSPRATKGESTPDATFNENASRLEPGEPVTEIRPTIKEETEASDPAVMNIIPYSAPGLTSVNRAFGQWVPYEDRLPPGWHEEMAMQRAYENKHGPKATNEWLKLREADGDTSIWHNKLSPSPAPKAKTKRRKQADNKRPSGEEIGDHHGVSGNGKHQHAAPQAKKHGKNKSHRGRDRYQDYGDRDRNFGGRQDDYSHGYDNDSRDHQGEDRWTTERSRSLIQPETFNDRRWTRERERETWQTSIACQKAKIAGRAETKLTPKKAKLALDECEVTRRKSDLAQSARSVSWEGSKVARQEEVKITR